MPSKRYLEHIGKKAPKPETIFKRHPNAVPHILVPRCQAMTANGEQCKNESSRWDFCFQHRSAAAAERDPKLPS